MKLIYDRELIEEQLQSIASRINIDYADLNPMFIVVLQGANVFYAELEKLLSIQHDCVFINTYRNQNKLCISKLPNLDNRNVIIIDDLLCSGNTLQKISNYIRNTYSIKSLSNCVLIYQNETNQTDIIPEYIMFKPDAVNYLVGFGLDVNGFGRDMKDIYTL